MVVSFKVSAEDMTVITMIVVRARKVFGKFSMKIDEQQLAMDITAVHANGHPLRLAELLESDNNNFSHDIGGIMKHIDRSTGQLKDCFVPRFAVRSE